jgi:hypothetical protein
MPATSRRMPESEGHTLRVSYTNAGTCWRRGEFDAGWSGTCRGSASNLVLEEFLPAALGTAGE